MRTPVHVKSYAMGLFTVLLVAFSTCLSTFSLVYPSLIIPSTGMIGLPGVIAVSGFAADIQTAVDTVSNAGGGTVYLPNSANQPDGKWHWNGETVIIPGGVNVVGASYAGCVGHQYNWQSYSASTILHNDAQPTSSYHPPAMFRLKGTNGKSTRISGIQFEATAPIDSSAESTSESDSTAIHGAECKNYRIDHCTFINFCYLSTRMDAYTNWQQQGGPSSYGVIDHCIYDNPYKDTTDPLNKGWLGGYGADAEGNMWDNTEVTLGIWLYAGKFQSIPDVSIMYVEDCHFSRCRHAIDGNQGAMMVTRFSLFDNPAKYQLQNNDIGEIDAHGGGWPSPYVPAPCVCVEAYNNTIVGRPNFGTNAIRIRGGSGLFYNNRFHPPDNYGGSNLQCLVYLDSDSNIANYQVKNTYIWNNDYSNCVLIFNGAGRTEGVDYYLRAPTLGQDGWTYSPCPYPLVAS